MNTKKIIIVLAIAALAGTFFALDLGRFLTLDHLKASQARFAALYAENTLTVLGAYFCLYVIMAALSLPGAAVMTLAGGALFGFWAALAAVSFASTLGACLAFLAARHLLRDWVQARFGNRLERVNRGIAQEGSFYLFTLRLIPAFPFFVINLAMGLTPMRTATFYWVSQLGMLPGTAVFVNAGTSLAGIDSLAGIISPSVLASFALLGLFPLAAKKTMDFWRRKKSREQPPT